MNASLRPGPGQPGGSERLLAGGVRDLYGVGNEVGELAPAPLAHGLHQSGPWNEQKKGKGCVSPYSSPMNSSGRYGEKSIRQAASRCLAGDARSVLRPVALGPVADLVVVLDADDEAIAATIPSGGAPCLRPRCGL